MTVYLVKMSPTYNDKSTVNRLSDMNLSVERLAVYRQYYGGNIETPGTCS